MAKQIIYDIQVKGLNQAEDQVKSLNDQVENLGDTFAKIGDGTDLSKTNDQLDETVKKVDEVSDSVEGLSELKPEIDGSGLKRFGTQANDTNEKIDKLSNAGERGFRALGEALRLFGVDSSILSDASQALGSFGDLLETQQKVKGVVFDSAPVKEQAQTIVKLKDAQAASTAATQAGAVATTASATATRGATIATNILNAALKALPWFAVIAAVTAVISIYQKWKTEQANAIKDIESGIKSLAGSLTKLGDDYAASVSRLNSETKKIQVENESVTGELQAQLALLEAQGATSQETLAIRKQINQAEIEGQADLIAKEKERRAELEAYVAAQNLLLEKTIQQGNSIRDQISLSEAGSDQTVELQKQLNDLITTESNIRKSINDSQRESNDLSTQIQSSENRLNVQKQFGLRIILAKNEQEKRTLELQREQERLQLDEKQKKLNEEIAKGIKNVEELRKQFVDVRNELISASQISELKFRFDSGDLQAGFDLLGRSADDFQTEFKKRYERNVKDLNDINLKAVAENESLIANLQESLVTILDKGSSATDQQLKDFGLRIGQAVKDIENQLMVDPLLPPEAAEITKKRIEDLISFIEGKLQSGEFKLKGLDQVLASGELDKLRTALASLGESYSEVTKTFEDKELINTSSVEASLTTLEEFRKNIEKFTGTVTGNVDELGSTIERQFDNINSQKLKLLFSGDLKKELDLSTDIFNSYADQQLQTILKIQGEWQDFIGKIAETNPELADSPLFKQIEQQILDLLLKAGIKIDQAKKNITSKSKQLLNEATKDAIDIVTKYADALTQLYQEFNALAAVEVENDLNRLQDYFDERNTLLEDQLSVEEEYRNLREEQIRSSNERINQLESQLATATGARAQFLQQLRAEEQARLQKADAERVASLNKAKKLEEEKKKLEAETEAEREKLERRKFELNKRSSVVGILLNTAKGIAQTIADEKLETVGKIIFSAIIASIGAVQLAAASAAKFAKGGLLNGPGHDQGGMAVVSQGAKVAELEGGEYIINRKSTQRNFALIRAINENPEVKFQNGGLIPSSRLVSDSVREVDFSASAARNQNAEMVRELTSAIAGLRIQASIQDIRDADAINLKIDDLRRL